MKLRRPPHSCPANAALTVPAPELTLTSSLAYHGRGIYHSHDIYRGRAKDPNAHI